MPQCYLNAGVAVAPAAPAPGGRTRFRKDHSTPISGTDTRSGQPRGGRSFRVSICLGEPAVPWGCPYATLNYLRQRYRVGTAAVAVVPGQVTTVYRTVGQTAT